MGRKTIGHTIMMVGNNALFKKPGVDVITGSELPPFYTV
jgi:hypothetical protein